MQFPRVQRSFSLRTIFRFALTLPDTKVVYRRYASLFFIAGCSSTDNELITLEIVHRYVEQMDKYYGNVCELDIIFNFQKAYFILDELLLAGEMQESSKKNVLRCINQQDSLEDMEVSMEQFIDQLEVASCGSLYVPSMLSFVSNSSVIDNSHICNKALTCSVNRRTKKSQKSCSRFRCWLSLLYLSIFTPGSSLETDVG